ncbi:SHOCT domain-containing protein [Streptomyces olivochromogenes]|uniref:SHOCT domain-containing protein n=1 Tax=Streptomyces olivochromogenes TaxID=1963 RepID=UPI001F273449|nr:SHOCT domain-containing protein [Streptomyces olivochromogenes]MCF3134084.1 SHOCT domain-containing protein [Streptomyces olivochromogenes]
MYLAYDYPLLSAFWTMLWFVLLVMWFVLLFKVIVDVFRDDSLNGWAKAGWLIFAIALPFLGVFVYVVARGKGMGQRELAEARERQAAFDSYVRQTAGTATRAGSVDDLTRLSELRSHGDITDEEFRRAKEQILAGGAPK